MRSVCFTLSLCLLTFSLSFGQETDEEFRVRASQYFLPPTIPYQVTYLLMNQNTGQLSGNFKMIRQFAYNQNGKGVMVKDIHIMAGQVTATSTRAIVFSQDAILVNSISTNSALDKPKSQVFTPPSILFKLPKSHEKLTWTSKETGYECSAQIKEHTILGITDRFLIVHTIHKMDNRNVIEAEYYLPGGLMFITVISKGKEQIMYMVSGH